MNSVSLKEKTEKVQKSNYLQHHFEVFELSFPTTRRMMIIGPY